jgi:hypothetical protein
MPVSTSPIIVSRMRSLVVEGSLLAFAGATISLPFHWRKDIASGVGVALSVTSC